MGFEGRFIEGQMQATLVAYHCAKPPRLQDLICSCQDRLCKHLGSAFHPYDIEQVHGTIAGLEGVRGDKGILNNNFRDYRNESRHMDFDGMLRLLRSTKLLPMTIRIGGFRPYECPFKSRGQAPYLRSISVQGDKAVAMGWPIRADASGWLANRGKYPQSLEVLRRKLQRFGVLHLYHRKKKDVDNDFFFQLGRVDTDRANEILAEEVSESLRAHLAGLKPTEFRIGANELFIVGYLDDKLPVTTSCRCSVTDSSLDGKLIRSLYL